MNILTSFSVGGHKGVATALRAITKSLTSKRGEISLIGKITSCGDARSRFKSEVLPFYIL